MRFIKQAFIVTLVGLYTIPKRFSSSIVAVVGIAGVVVVLVAVLSIALATTSDCCGSATLIKYQPVMSAPPRRFSIR